MTTNHQSPPTQPERRKSNRLKPEWWNRFHFLWTWAVGKEGYNKAAWQDLEMSIQKAIEKDNRK